MKLWIIYQDGLVLSQVIAETLQDRLDNYIDVSVGIARKIDPSFIVEELFEYLILGDTITDPMPSEEIQNWVRKCGKLIKKNNLRLKALSGVLMILTEITTDTRWVEFIHENIMAETMYPPILCLKYDKPDLTFDSGVRAMVKEYSNKFIDFIIKAY